MEKLFVPYELAVLAKEKGFDELCLGFYYVNDKDTDIHYVIIPIKNSDLGEGYLAAPLYQQLVDWFREKKKIWIYIFPIQWSHNNIDSIQWAIRDFNKTGEYSSDKHILYYTALTEALKEAFKLI